ncbi:MAG: hypothetical protein EOO01_29865 [Chitinophagaceae bacterium]|nr:MAG: hypothetical protein EOO01_29865 [Chitinophagaceae bacterium]
MTRLCIYLFMIVMNPLPGLAQDISTDSAFHQQALHHVIKLYKDSLSESLQLYSGTEFTAAYRSSAGHPFFESTEAQPGDVIYNEIRYPGMSLKYDLVNDELVFINPGNDLNIILINQKVNGFTIRDHLFIHVREGVKETRFPGEGFYELLYNGPVQVLLKRSKLLRDAARPEDPARFLQLNTYYIKKAGTWYEIDSKRSLLAACKDRKQELSKYIQQENLDFKKDPARTIVKVIDHYVQLAK